MTKLQGGMVKLPGEGAKQDEMDRFFAKLGRPESPDKYDIKRGELPEGLDWDDALEGAFRAQAHQLGLNNKQAQAIVDLWTEQRKAAFQSLAEQVETSRVEAEKALKAEWGHAYDQKAQLAVKGLEYLGGEELADLVQSELGNNPKVMKAFAKLGESLMESGIITGDAGENSGDSERARQEITEIRSKLTHDKNPDNPNLPLSARKANAAHMADLFARAKFATGAGQGREG
jgi:hypothetical protein